MPTHKHKFINQLAATEETGIPEDTRQWDTQSAEINRERALPNIQKAEQQSV